MTSQKKFALGVMAVLALSGGAMLAGLRLAPEPAANSETTDRWAGWGRVSGDATTPPPGETPWLNPTPAPLAQVVVRTGLMKETLAPASLQAFQSLQRLAQLPAGEAAIALGQELEAGIRPDNARGYALALLLTAHPTVERAAIAALARQADGELLLALAGEYGALPPEHRGRVLQVLEMAGNPEALSGLAGIVAADTSEKRSPLVMSALVGAAHLGTMDSVQYLLSQLTPASADFALMALERVASPQGLQMLRAAALGNKDTERIPAAYRDALRRIVENGGKG